MDCDEDSLLASWPGRDLLPWIQNILERVGNSLWVTDQKSENPFSNIAHSFIRTIQAEHPSTKLANLHLEENHDADFLAKSVFDVYESMLHGLEEVELITRDRRIHILRYQPDDELSASVGLAPPTTSSTPLGNSDYSLSLAGPRKAVLLSERCNDIRIPTEATVRVAIENSVVDCEDAVKFGGGKSNRKPWKGLGQFFAGRVVSSHEPHYPFATEVIGWCPGAHQSQLEVPIAHVRRLQKSEGSAAIAVTEYAAYASALAVLEGTARIRRSETLEICVSGMLGEALRRVCSFLGVIITSSSNTCKDFTVSFDVLEGLLLNGRPVSVEKFMISEAQRGSIDKLLESNISFTTPITTFELSDYQQAFDTAETNPLSTVIADSGFDQVASHILCYKRPKQLLRQDGAYIILGGLGGLGRYLSTWMISNGAKNLVVISRSGLTTDEAHQTVKSIQDLGGRCDVVKTDASDNQALDVVLSSVRKTFPIRGVLNMAMVLDDSPFMTMTGDQWDRTKVDTSWNLHRSTLSDSLDFFIVFSSISSLIGNRTQANYAAGTAFQNAIAKYRRSLGLTGIAIALGAVTGIGVLANNEDLLRTLAQTGLSHVGPHELVKIMEAAILESHYSDRSLLCVGLEMFETLDGKVQSKSDQNQLYWTEQPEFGFLLDHRFSSAGLAKEISMRDQLIAAQGEMAHQNLLDAFLSCLSNVLGYDTATIDPTSPIASYGLDSLNAVSCRYWFFKQLEVDVPVSDILGCKSINILISRVLEKIQESSGSSSVAKMPQPVHNVDLGLRPLSHSQRRLWFLHHFISDKTVYNLLLVCHIKGAMNVALFSKAWSIFVQRHEILHKDCRHGRWPAADSSWRCAIPARYCGNIRHCIPGSRGRYLPQRKKSRV